MSLIYLYINFMFCLICNKEFVPSTCLQHDLNINQYINYITDPQRTVSHCRTLLSV